MSDNEAAGSGGEGEQKEEKKFFADVAKTGRATCRKCKQKLESGNLRLAKAGYNPFGPGLMKQWHHVDCLFEVFTKQRKTTAKIETPDDIEGWSDLDDDDRETILKHLPDCSIDDWKNTPGKTKRKDKKETPAKKGAKKDTKKKEDDKQTQKDHKDNSFREFRRLCADISNTSEYKGKTAIVKKLFTEGTDGSGFKGDLLLWCRLLLPGHVKRVYNLQSKQLVKLFSRIFSTDQDDMLEHLESGDVAETISVFFEKSDKVTPTKKSLLTLEEVDQFLEQLTKLTKEDEQVNLFKTVIKRCTSNDLKMFIRLVNHDLRINAGPKHILEAVHEDAYPAFQSSYNIEAVISKVLNKTSSGVSSSSKKTSLDITISVMTPVLPMLAEACKSVEMAMKKCPNGMYSEIKYDGERVQLHKKGDEYKYFSRSLKPVMPHKVSPFKDYIPEAFPHGNDLILDCEVLMIDTHTGKPLPFGTLGVHKKTAFKDANVCLFVFDCIYYNGNILTKKPIKERRKILLDSMTEVPNRILFSEVEEIHKPKDLESMITKVLQQGLEGLVLKDLMSIYEPGKRHWLKVKKDYLFGGAMADSADLVVLGAWFGTGQKGGMMSVFLMGCYDPSRQKWCTVTKVHTGHDDKTLERLQDELQMIKISKEASKVPNWLNCTKTMIPDFVAKDPKEMPVWEITGAEFTQQHDVHTADGISIRFPRVTKIRDDKDWKTATSLPELRVLFKRSKDSASFAMPSTSNKGEQTDDEEEEDENNTKSESKTSDKKPKKINSKDTIKKKRKAENEDEENGDSDSGSEYKKGKKDSSKRKLEASDEEEDTRRTKKSTSKRKMDIVDSDEESKTSSKKSRRRNITLSTSNRKEEDSDVSVSESEAHNEGLKNKQVKDRGKKEKENVKEHKTSIIDSDSEDQYSRKSINTDKRRKKHKAEEKHESSNEETSKQSDQIAVVSSHKSKEYKEKKRLHTLDFDEEADTITKNSGSKRETYKDEDKPFDSDKESDRNTKNQKQQHKRKDKSIILDSHAKFDAKTKNIKDKDKTPNEDETVNSDSKEYIKERKRNINNKRKRLEVKDKPESSDSSDNADSDEESDKKTKEINDRRKKSREKNKNTVSDLDKEHVKITKNTHERRKKQDEEITDIIVQSDENLIFYKESDNKNKHANDRQTKYKEKDVDIVDSSKKIEKRIMNNDDKKRHKEKRDSVNSHIESDSKMKNDTDIKKMKHEERNKTINSSSEKEPDEKNKCINDKEKTSKDAAADLHSDKKINKRVKNSNPEKMKYKVINRTVNLDSNDDLDSDEESVNKNKSTIGKRKKQNKNTILNSDDESDKAIKDNAKKRKKEDIQKYEDKTIDLDSDEEYNKEKTPNEDETANSDSKKGIKERKRNINNKRKKLEDKDKTESSDSNDNADSDEESDKETKEINDKRKKSREKNKNTVLDSDEEHVKVTKNTHEEEECDKATGNTDSKENKCEVKNKAVNLNSVDNLDPDEECSNKNKNNSDKRKKQNKNIILGQDKKSDKTSKNAYKERKTHEEGKRGQEEEKENKDINLNDSEETNKSGENIDETEKHVEKETANLDSGKIPEKSRKSNCNQEDSEKEIGPNSSKKKIYSSEPEVKLFNLKTVCLNLERLDENTLTSKGNSQSDTQENNNLKTDVTISDIGECETIKEVVDKVKETEPLSSKTLHSSKEKREREKSDENKNSANIGNSLNEVSEKGENIKIPFLKEKVSENVPDKEETGRNILDMEQNAEVGLDKVNDREIIYSKKEDGDIISGKKKDTENMSDTVNSEKALESEEIVRIASREEKDSEIMSDKQKVSEKVHNGEESEKLSSDSEETLTSVPDKCCEVMIEKEKKINDIIPAMKKHSEKVSDKEGSKKVSDSRQNIKTIPEKESEIECDKRKSFKDASDNHSNENVSDSSKHNVTVVSDKENESEIFSEEEQHCQIIFEKSKNSEIISDKVKGYEQVFDKRDNSDEVSKTENPKLLCKVTQEIIPENVEYSEIKSKKNTSLEHVCEEDDLNETSVIEQDTEILCEKDQDSDIVSKINYQASEKISDKTKDCDKLPNRQQNVRIINDKEQDIEKISAKIKDFQKVSEKISEKEQRLEIPSYESQDTVTVFSEGMNSETQADKTSDTGYERQKKLSDEEDTVEIVYEKEKENKKQYNTRESKCDNEQNVQSSNLGPDMESKMGKKKQEIHEELNERINKIHNTCESEKQSETRNDINRQNACTSDSNIHISSNVSNKEIEESKQQYVSEIIPNKHKDSTLLSNKCQDSEVNFDNENNLVQKENEKVSKQNSVKEKTDTEEGKDLSDGENGINTSDKERDSQTVLEEENIENQHTDISSHNRKYCNDFFKFLQLNRVSNKNKGTEISPKKKNIEVIFDTSFENKEVCDESIDDVRAFNTDKSIRNVFSKVLCSKERDSGKVSEIKEGYIALDKITKTLDNRKIVTEILAENGDTSCADQSGDTSTLEKEKNNQIVPDNEKRNETTPDNEQQTEIVPSRENETNNEDMEILSNSDTERQSHSEQYNDILSDHETEELNDKAKSAMKPATQITFNEGQDIEKLTAEKAITDEKHSDIDCCSRKSTETESVKEKNDKVMSDQESDIEVIYDKGEHKTHKKRVIDEDMCDSDLSCDENLSNSNNEKRIYSSDSSSDEQSSKHNTDNKKHKMCKSHKKIDKNSKTAKYIIQNSDSDEKLKKANEKSKIRKLNKSNKTTVRKNNNLTKNTIYSSDSDEEVEDKTENNNKKVVKKVGSKGPLKRHKYVSGHDTNSDNEVAEEARSISKKKMIRGNSSKELVKKKKISNKDSEYNSEEEVKINKTSVDNGKICSSDSDEVLIEIAKGITKQVGQKEKNIKRNSKNEFSSSDSDEENKKTLDNSESSEESVSKSKCVSEQGSDSDKEINRKRSEEEILSSDMDERIQFSTAKKKSMRKKIVDDSGENVQSATSKENINKHNSCSVKKLSSNDATSLSDSNKEVELKNKNDDETCSSDSDNEKTERKKSIGKIKAVKEIMKSSSSKNQESNKHGSYSGSKRSKEEGIINKDIINNEKDSVKSKNFSFQKKNKVKPRDAISVSSYNLKELRIKLERLNVVELKEKVAENLQPKSDITEMPTSTADMQNRKRTKSSTDPEQWQRWMDELDNGDEENDKSHSSHDSSDGDSNGSINESEHSTESEKSKSVVENETISESETSSIVRKNDVRKDKNDEAVAVLDSNESSEISDNDENSKESSSSSQTKNTKVKRASKPPVPHVVHEVSSDESDISDDAELHKTVHLGSELLKQADPNENIFEVETVKGTPNNSDVETIILDSDYVHNRIEQSTTMEEHENVEDIPVDNSEEPIGNGVDNLPQCSTSVLKDKEISKFLSTKTAKNKPTEAVKNVKNRKRLLSTVTDSESHNSGLNPPKRKRQSASTNHDESEELINLKIENEKEIHRIKVQHLNELHAIQMKEASLRVELAELLLRKEQNSA